jgi:NAD(P)-dependent dehydrogenase (short-subunit alcohol dehydrogenase family)
MQPPRANSPRSVVVTGASTGIGLACALHLDKLGFRVFAGARKDEDCRRLQSQASPQLAPLLLDVTRQDHIDAAAARIGEIVGDAGLAGLVNNAGIAVAGPVELLPLAEFRRQFEVNLFGQIAVTQALLPLLKAARGRIVNMGSLSGKIATPYLAPYCASKHALEALTDALRLELRRFGVEVSIVEPGSVDTPIWGKSRAEADRLAEELLKDADPRYQEDIDAVRKATDRLGRKGIPPSKVVDAVVHALTAPRPKTRYPVARATAWTLWAFLRVPDRLWDRIVLRALGLKR